MFPDLPFSTIEKFSHASSGANPYNPAIPVKDWIDPTAASIADEDGNVSYTVLAYGADGKASKGPDGKPYTRTMTISADRAGSLNLLPNGMTVKLPLPGITRMPLDLSKIPAGYRLDWDNGPTPMTVGQVVLRNPTVDPTDPVPFTRAIADQIAAIAVKLGV